MLLRILCFGGTGRCRDIEGFLYVAWPHQGGEQLRRVRSHLRNLRQDTAEIYSEFPIMSSRTRTYSAVFQITNCSHRINHSRQQSHDDAAKPVESLRYLRDDEHKPVPAEFLETYHK